MKSRNMVLNLMLVFLLAACAASATDAMDKPGEEMTEQPTEAMMPHDTPMPDTMAEPTQAEMMDSPAWFGASFKDVRSGDSFTVNDFHGKVILVETMAVWCTTCFQQQNQIKALRESLGMRDDFVIVSLDIDPNEDESILSGYTQQNSGFDWRYAIASSDVIREIGNTYGNQFLNPPSAPVLVIDRHGAAHPLPFGLKSADDLRQVIQPYLDESL